MDTIYFYTANDPYGELSNFARYGSYKDDVYWRTAEHYFQAQKFEDEKLREKIRRTPSPLKAKHTSTKTPFSPPTKAKSTN